MDMLGILEERALLGSSNPGIFSSMAGGACLNTASIACQLGLECSIIAQVGDDQAARNLKQTLADRKIGDYLKLITGETTGIYVSIIEPDGNLHIAIADLGLNEKIEINWLMDNHQDVLKNSDIWFLNSNISTPTLSALCKLAKEDEKILHPKIIAAASISRSKSLKLANILQHVDVLFTNIAEARAMLNAINAGDYDDRILDIDQCIDGLMDLGIRKCSISQGGEALWVFENETRHKFIPPKLGSILDVTGAGDALAGTFLSALANGISMAKAAPLAIAAAQMIICTHGPYNDKINLEELTCRANAK